MLRAIMECRGKFSHKILRKAQFAGLHFDDLLNFRSVEKDKLSNKVGILLLYMKVRNQADTFVGYSAHVELHEADPRSENSPHGQCERDG